MRQATGFLLLACIAGALIAATRSFTAERIANNAAHREATIIADLLGGKPDASAADRLCRAEVRGYAGSISILVLPNSEQFQRLTAVRVIQHSETPGIGDFIDHKKSDWIEGFASLPLSTDARTNVTQWDNTLDGVTGATVTRRAVINGAANACIRASSQETPKRGTDEPA